MPVVAAPRYGAFISYARADGETAARELYARLQANAPDISVWLDRFQVEGGVGWWTQIERELDRAEFLLLVMTPAALRSENTRNEWRGARQRGVCVYPVKGAPDAELDYDSLPNWMRKAHFYDPDAEWEKLVAHLRRGCRATRVPFMAPPLSTAFVNREREVQTVINLLTSGGQQNRSGIAASTALRGPGGFGKTTLATAVAHDDRVIDTFDDGILWATLGPNPNVLNELVKLYAALTGDRPGFVDIEDAVRELTVVLEHKNCLIVVDDTWSTSHLRPFMRGGPGCARLITTRSLDVTTGLQRVDIDKMTSSEAVTLLAAYAGVLPHNVASLTLATQLGFWPLAIKLAASAMRRRIERGDTVENALAYLSRALEKRGITAFDASHGSEREDAVARTIGASFELLSSDDQQRCADLAVLREAAAIPVATAALLWGLDDIDAEDLARSLDDLGLIEFDLARGTLRIHGVLRDFFATRITDETAVHRRLVDQWRDPYTLPNAYAWRQFTFHMRAAGLAPKLRDLLLDGRWLEAKLRATDVQAVIEDFGEAESDPVLSVVRDALKLAAPSVATAPAQFGPQLVARTSAATEPEILAFRDSARRLARAPWLELLHPTVDTQGGALVTTLVGHTRDVLALASNADFTRIVSGSEDGTVRHWDAHTGNLCRVLKSRALGVRAITLTPDGRIVLVGGADGHVTVWDLENGQQLARFSREAGRAITSVAVSADGRLALTASRDRVIRVWDVASHTVLHVLVGHDDEVTSVDMSATGERAVSGADDFTVRVWRVREGRLERTLAGHSSTVNAVAISPDGRHALSGSTDCTVRLWSLETGACLQSLSGHGSSVTAVALAPEAWKAALGSSDGSVKIWDLEQDRVVADLRGHSGEITAVAVDSSCAHAASASVDRTVKIWRPTHGSLKVAIDTHAAAVSALVLSDDGRLCASGGEDGAIKIVDVASGRVIRDVPAHAGAAVRTLAFSSDQACVLSAGDDLGHWLWTIDSGQGIWIPVRHIAPVDSYALSQSGGYLVTSCSDRFVYRWEVPSGVIVDSYGTRRLFDHLISPSPWRSELSDTDFWADRYLDGEPIYEVVVVRTSRNGTYAALSAMRREHGGLGHSAERQRERHAGDRLPACVAVANLTASEVWSVEFTQNDPISALAIDESGLQVLCARADHAIEVWVRDGDEPAAVLRGHTDKVRALAVFDDGIRAVSCGRDRSVRVWDLERATELAAFTVDAAIRSVAVTPDGRVVAVGDEAGRVHLFRIASGLIETPRPLLIDNQSMPDR